MQGMACLCMQCLRWKVEMARVRLCFQHMYARSLCVRAENQGEPEGLEGASSWQVAFMVGKNASSYQVAGIEKVLQECRANKRTSEGRAHENAAVFARSSCRMEARGKMRSGRSVSERRVWRRACLFRAMPKGPLC